MRRFLFILPFFFLTALSYAQDCEAFKKHLHSIKRTSIIEGKDTVFNDYEAFVNYTIKNLLSKPSDKCFISNRNLLRKLNIISCTTTETIIKDTLQNGDTCHIQVSVGKFNANNHFIERNEKTGHIEKIDGQYPFDGQYVIPKVEIRTINIKINGSKISIPKTAYANLYNPNLCTNYIFDRQIEAYESFNGQYIYLYIYGGNAAGTYFAKLIFDRNGYQTKIISGYYALSIHGSFREDFIGF